MNMEGVIKTSLLKTFTFACLHRPLKNYMKMLNNYTISLTRHVLQICVLAAKMITFTSF